MKVTRTPKSGKTVMPKYVAHDKQNLIRSNPLPNFEALAFAKFKSVEYGVLFYIDRVDGKASKYNAIKCAYLGNIYDSIKEAHYAVQLDIKQKAGIVKTINRQVGYTYNVTYSNDKGDKVESTAKYIADFVVGYTDGHTEVVDVKGLRTPAYKAKKKIIEHLYKIKIIEA
jgi:hypothetical protein